MGVGRSGRHQTECSRTPSPPGFQPPLTTTTSELRRLVEEVVSRVRYFRPLTDGTARRGRRVAADGVQSLNELHVLEHAGTIGQCGEREPWDRGRIGSAAIGDSPDHTATTVALPRRTAEVIRDFP